MTPVMTGSTHEGAVARTQGLFSWTTIAWVSLLLAICYAPVLSHLGWQWVNDEDMGHGMFVPLIAGFIAWQKRDQIAGIAPKTNWWGAVIMTLAALQLWLATLGAELFTQRTSIVFS